MMDLKRAWRNGSSALVLLLMGALTPSVYADSINLLVNGSFENPIVPADSTCGPFANCVGYHNGVAGNDNIGGWQLIGKAGLDSFGNPIPGASATVLLLGYNYTEPDELSGLSLFFHPQDGLQSVDLTGEGNQGTTNGIKQAVATEIGHDYQLSFWLGHQYSFAPGYTGSGGLALYLNGGMIGSFVNDGNRVEDVIWTPFSYNFQATDTETVIAFLNDTPVGNNYAGLDNVSLFAIPEPPVLLLIALGLVCVISLVLFRLRKRA